MTKADSQQKNEADFSVSTTHVKPTVTQNSSVIQGKLAQQPIVYSRKAAIVWALIYTSWTAYLIYVVLQLAS
jgi:hypothetical protein